MSIGRVAYEAWCKRQWDYDSRSYRYPVWDYLPTAAKVAWEEIANEVIVGLIDSTDSPEKPLS